MILLTMEELIYKVIGGVLVAIITTIFGIGGTKRVVVHGSSVRKTGKWIIIVSVLMIIGGLAWAGSNSPTQGGFDFSKPGTIYGLTLAGYGLIALIIGRIVAWFQRD